MAAIDRRVKPRPTGELSVAFIGEAEMRRINRERRGKDKVTDVLSFSFEGPEAIGEVLICYPQAKRQAAERGHTVRQEVLDLLIHGTLHILGFDHETPRDAKEMLPLQQRILTAL
jgi:probable rRNA maturation factor